MIRFDKEWNLMADKRFMNEGASLSPTDCIGNSASECATVNEDGEHDVCADRGRPRPGTRPGAGLRFDETNAFGLGMDANRGIPMGKGDRNG